MPLALPPFVLIGLVAVFQVGGLRAQVGAVRHALAEDGEAEEEVQADPPQCSPVKGKLQLPKGGGQASLLCDEHLQPLRRRFEVEDPDEICRENEVNLGADAKASAGKSSAQFIFTADKKYIFKTMSGSDFRAFERIVSQYKDHMTSNSRNSLLVRIYAVFYVAETKTYWMVMNNWTPVTFPKLYDLKGSTENRRSEPGSMNLKDLNWLDHIAQGGAKILLAPLEANTIMDAIKADTAMLASAKLLDYSLLVGQLEFAAPRCGGLWQPSCLAPICGAHTGCIDASFSPDDGPGLAKDGLRAGNPFSAAGRTGSTWMQMRQFFCEGEVGSPTARARQRMWGIHDCVGSMSSSKPHVLLTCFGIVDILKYYGVRTRIEHLVMGGPFYDISAQPPTRYKERFDTFMVDKVFGPPDPDQRVLQMWDSTCRWWGARQQAERIFPVSGVTFALMATIAGLCLIPCIACYCFFARKHRDSDEMFYEPSEYEQKVHPTSRSNGEQDLAYSEHALADVPPYGGASPRDGPQGQARQGQAQAVQVKGQAWLQEERPMHAPNNPQALRWHPGAAPRS